MSVEARSEKSVEAHLGEFDVLLLGPQVRYVLKSMEKAGRRKVPCSSHRYAGLRYDEWSQSTGYSAADLRRLQSK